MPATKKTLLINVRVFDGQKIRPPGFVIIDGGVIGTNPKGAHVVDGRGGVLLPGLIDSHVHLNSIEDLKTLRSFGVTTAFDMESQSLSILESLRGHEGLTDIRAAGFAAHYQRPGNWPPEGEVANADEAALFVAHRASQGSDFIKIIADPSSRDKRGLDQSTMNAIVGFSHQFGLLVVAHAIGPTGFKMAQDAQVDIITHTPLAPTIDGTAMHIGISRMVSENRVCIPTLTMMEGIAGASAARGSFSHAETSLEAMYTLGTTILAGTDSNQAPAAPFQPPHGSSLHHELELLVGAGMTTLDVLRAATELPAKHFGLLDRGRIEPGLRADLVLIADDPIQDIRATRGIQKVWCGGQLYEPVQPPQPAPVTGAFQPPPPS